MGFGYYFKLYHCVKPRVFFYIVTYDRESVTDFKRLVAIIIRQLCFGYGKIIAV